MLLDKGVLEAMRKCLWIYGQHDFQTEEEHSVAGGSSKVDYVVQVDDEDKVLCEAKSPSVMKRASDLLPVQGIELTWVGGQPLVPKLLAKVICHLLSVTLSNKIFTGCFVSRSKAA